MESRLDGKQDGEFDNEDSCKTQNISDTVESSSWPT